MLVLCRQSNRVDKYFRSLDEDEWSDEEDENESPSGRPSLGGAGDAAAAVNPGNARSVFGDRSLASSNQQQTVRYDTVVLSMDNYCSFSSFPYPNLEKDIVRASLKLLNNFEDAV